MRLNENLNVRLNRSQQVSDNSRGEKYFHFYWGVGPPLSYPPRQDCGRRKDKYMNEGKMKTLENLEPAMLTKVLELAASARLIDCVDALKEHGIDVSKATLGRFVQKHRQKVMLESGEDMLEAAETLRARGKKGALREGTLEALRQRLFEKALNETTADEELRTMYLDLVKEEAKLKELELSERRVAVAEDLAKLARVKARMELRDRERKNVELVENAVAVTEVKLLAEGEDEKGGKKELVDLLVKVMEVVNGAGRAEEKVLEARAVLGAGMKLLDEARSG
jgi:hypothetical protein